MSTVTQGRNLQYRVARFHNLKGVLQPILSKALKAYDHPKDRLQPLDKEGTDHQLINYVSTQRGMLCGNMVIYSRGAAQLLMRTQEVKNAGDEASSYPLEAFDPPKAVGGARQEFLESILYFCISGNHILLMQARGLRAKAFEEYIRWLTHKAGTLTTEQDVMLADQPGSVAKKAIERSHVKAVSLGLPLLEAEAEIENEQAKVRVGGRMVRALRELLGAKVDHMRLEDALNGNIEATIELRWSHQTTAPAQGVLDSLAIAMRNVEPDEVQIKLNDGTTVVGHDLKLVVPIKVTLRDNIVEQTSLFKEMRESMKKLLETGAIEA